MQPAFATPAGVHSLNHDVTLKLEEARIRVAYANHMGYPYNLAFSTDAVRRFDRYLVNNLGDPYAGSHYGAEVCGLERQAIAWFEELWGCETGDDSWGSIGASGTEGNLWALYLGRETLPGAVLVHSAEAHYSIPKSARILRMETRKVECSSDGAISIAHLGETLRGLGGRPVVLALTCGTTLKGAHDDIAASIAALDEAGYEQDQRFVHIDGALNAMVLPFVVGAPANIQPSFRMSIDTLSTSGHKMIGTPMPCGVLIARRQHVDRIVAAVSYLRSNDTTLMGSRNGHAVLAVWDRVMRHGVAGFTRDVAGCLGRTDRFTAALRQLDVPVLRNPFSLTVLFPTPSEVIVRKYQLACDKGRAHAIIMPNVDDALIDHFIDEYAGWRRMAGDFTEASIL